MVADDYGCPKSARPETGESKRQADDECRNMRKRWESGSEVSVPNIRGLSTPDPPTPASPKSVRPTCLFWPIHASYVVDDV